VARHLSFTLAAQELCVTQSAISHRIRRLEQHFGRPLIRRLNPGLALTAAGTALLPELVAALDSLARLGQRGERRLRVTAASALCTWWLAERLPAFMRSRPGVSVELVPVDTPQATVADVDVSIRWIGVGDDAQSERQSPLCIEQVFPVCSPQLLPEGRPLRQAQAQAMRTLSLLHKSAYPAGEWSWAFWLDRLQVDAGARAASELRFADMGLLMSAAVGGAGVALTRSLLAHDALRSGRLVLPVSGIAPASCGKRHVARWPSAKSGDADVRAFVDWLVTQSAETVLATRQLIERGAGSGD
jgi:LysR family glycine cleavage system transcriptional activator